MAVDRTEIRNGTWYEGDCFDVMRTLPDASVDMVLCDLPYGTTQNKWDSVLPLDALWAEYWRICKPNAAVVLTAAQPFSSAVVMSQPDAFGYEWIWRKTNATGHLNARKQPMREHEVVLVFYRNWPPYNAQGLEPYGKITRRSPMGSANYGAFAAENYQEWTNWPKSILTYGYDSAKIHPTQKPVALFEYLIRTYTNPGDHVLDNSAGSGTTAVAAEQTGRRWTCIERDPEYSMRAQLRLAALTRASLTATPQP